MYQPLLLHSPNLRFQEKSQLKDLSVRKLQSSQLLTVMEAGIVFSWLHRARIFGDPWIKTRTSPCFRTGSFSKLMNLPDSHLLNSGVQSHRRHRAPSLSAPSKRNCCVLLVFQYLARCSEKLFLLLSVC